MNKEAMHGISTEEGHESNDVKVGGCSSLVKPDNDYYFER